jgi:hypothetical protein
MVAGFVGVWLAALPALASAQTTTPEGNPPEGDTRLPAGLVYMEEFNSSGGFTRTFDMVRYPQWGEAVIEEGQLCNEVPQGDFFDTLPLPLMAGDFYAEVVATAYNELDTSVGFALGDFATQGFDLLFFMNDFQGVWRTERWYYPRTPGLQQRSSARAEEAHWRAGEPMRIGLEAVNGVYTMYLERDGEMMPMFEDTFTPEGNGIALAIWGSMEGPRRVCFDSVTVRATR